jgi:YggT family protein
LGREAGPQGDSRLPGLDGSTLVLAWISQFAWLCTLALLVGGGGFDGSTWATFALLACVELVKALIWLLIIVVIAQAVLSWVAPDGPFAGTLNAMTFRFLAPIRRVVPPVGGTLDLSPLILIVVLQLILILPIRWLESAVLRCSGDDACDPGIARAAAVGRRRPRA